LVKVGKAKIYCNIDSCSEAFWGFGCHFESVRLNHRLYKYLDGGLLSLTIDQMRASQTHLSWRVDACAAAKLVVCQEIPEQNYPWQESSRMENVRFVDTFAGFCV